MPIREIECPVCKQKALATKYRLVTLVSAFQFAREKQLKQEVLYARICPNPKCNVVFYDRDYDTSMKP
jgi:predicted RNA-binding Zn ribbon-like protein